jgi:hypothetical protein
VNINDVRIARSKAMQDIETADNAVKMVASLCAGRLRIAGVSGYVLEKLKRELKDYNMHTGCWKDN